MSGVWKYTIVWVGVRHVSCSAHAQKHLACNGKVKQYGMAWFTNSINGKGQQVVLSDKRSLLILLISLLI